LALLDLLVFLVHKDLKERLDRKEHKELLVLKDLQGQWDRPDRKEHKELLVLKDLQGQWDRPDHRAQQVVQDLRVHKVLPDRKVSLVLRVLLGRRVQLVHKGQLVSPDHGVELLKLM
jgi:hypothetical protein